MFTTLVNPTVWLLGALLASALWGAGRRQDARGSLAPVVRLATSWPLLAALVLLAAGSLGSRATLGFLSPGAYAEEVVAARSFLENRELYGAHQRSQLAEWLRSPAEAVPWESVPLIAPCQGSALVDRGRFYTAHAHPPTLLVAGIPLVRAGGARALYVALLILSLSAIAAMTAAALSSAGIPFRSREALLVLSAIAGWQPVLAGIRQGDAVLPAAGLIAVAWLLVRRGMSASAAMSASIAGGLALPAAGAMLGLARHAPRAGCTAVLAVAAMLGLTGVVAGWDVLTGFVRTVSDTAITYAPASSNYALIGRLPGLELPAGVVFAVVTVAIAISWRAPDAETALAGFVMLGLLVAPVVWSQHLALLLVPASITLRRTLNGGSAGALALWGAVMLSCSLPDGTTPLIASYPVVPPALGVLWGWSLLGDRRRGAVPDSASTTTLAALR